MPVHTYLRTSLKWSGFILLGLLLLLTLCFFLLQTGPAKKQLASILSSFLSREALQIEISGVQGWVPIDFSLNTVRCSDAHGAFLDISQARLSWSPLALFQGSILVQDLGAGKIHLQRRPALPDKPVAEKSRDNRGPSFQLPPLRIEQMDFPLISLGAALLGQEAVFSLQGGLDLRSLSRFEGRLQLERIDRPGLSSRLQAGYKEPNLDLDWRLQAPGSGLLHTFSKQLIPGDLDLQLQGNGPPDSWSGQLNLTLERHKVLNTSLQLNFTPPDLGLTTRGTVQAAGFLPPPYSGLLDKQPPLPFSIDLDYDLEKKLLRLHALELHTNWGELRLAGTADAEARTLRQQVQLHIKRLAALQPLLPLPISGKADIEADIRGPWNLPSADLKCSTRMIRVGDFKAAGNTLKLQIEPHQDATASLQSINIEGDLQNRELTHAGLGLSLPLAELVLDAACDLDGSLLLRNLQLKTPNEALQLSGRGSLKGPFRARLQADLTTLDNLPADLALPFSGGLSLKSEFKGNWQSRLVSSRIRVQFRDLAALPSDLLALTGKSPRLSSDLTLNGTGLTLEKTMLKGPNLDLSLSGGLELNSRELDLDWSMSGPRLKHFGFAQAHKAGGTLQAHGSLQGPVDSLQSTLQVKVSDMRFPPLQSSGLTLKASADQLPRKPQGHIALVLAGTNQALSLETDFAFVDKLLQLRGLEARAPKTELQGGLELDLKKSSLHSDLQLRSGDLAWLQSFFPGQAVSGGLDLQLRARGPFDNPAVHTNFQGQNLKVSKFSLEEISGRLDIPDFKNQELNLQLAATNLAAGDLLAAETEFTAEGARDRYRLSLETRGQALKPYQLKSAGSLSLENQGQVLSLASGEAAYAGIPLAWSSPLRLERSPAGLRLACDDMKLGHGRTEFSASLNKDRLQASIDISDFDFSTLDMAGLPQLLGQGTLNLEVSGSSKRPEMDLRLGLTGLRPVSEDVGNLPPLSADLRAAYHEDILSAELRAESPGTADLHVTSRLSAGISLDPFAFQPGEDLRGKASCNADLSSVSALFNLSGQQIKGLLHSELRIAGSVSEPEMSGTADLKKGEYQNAATGTILKDIALDCTFDQRTISLDSLSASDGQDGRIKVRGSLELLPENAFTARAEARLDGARLVRLNFLDARTTGDLQFRHTPKDSRLSGNLSIAPVELGIPEAQPEGLEGLRIVRSGDQAQSPALQPKPKDRTQPNFLSALNMDLVISIPSRFFVRGQGLDSEWGGEFTIGNTAAAPKISGGVELIRGHIEFLTKRFDLQSGTITFVNEVPPKPLLNIKAKTRSGDLIIYLTVTGSATDPEFSLGSEPALPRDEILAKLLFNTELRDINAFQAVKLALAVKALSSGGSGQGLLGSFRKSLGLDELEIQSDTASEEGGTTVGMGKYLSEDIYFKVEQGLGQDSTEVSVSIALTPSIGLETRAGSLSQGMEFFWEYSY